MMQGDNISIHCENGYIVESFETTAAVAPSAGDNYFIIYLFIFSFFQTDIHMDA